MKYEKLNIAKKKYDIGTTTLIIFTFSTIFYSRIFCSIAHAPSALNFFHFVAALVTFGVAITTTRAKNREQIYISLVLLVHLFIFIVVMFASAILNEAGLVNLVFNFLILGEPFLLLVAIIATPLSFKQIERIRFWILISALINFLAAEVQYFMLSTGRMGMVGGYTLEDQVQGTFYLAGAGGYVSAGISVMVGLYFFLYIKSIPTWLRMLVFPATIHHIVISDTKQVFLTCFLGWVLLVLSKFLNIKQFFTYGICLGLGLYAFYWAAYNVEGLKLFGYFLDRTDMYQGPDAGPSLKIEGIRMVISYYKSPLNWLFGLGPGHTLGRLGGWTIHDYWSLLGPLGATTHPLYGRIWELINSSWILMSSTFFVPLFSWAGIWGDIGFLGLGSYLYLGIFTWQRLCLDDFSKYLVLNTLVYGFFLTQMEEPGYMISVALLIGLHWHERKHVLEAHSSQVKVNLFVSTVIKL
ncbi:hypothetical protein NIES4101_65850 [Calothrix sp. NIES-4101]|nr:hypothetical protein NIES4101_65850 [Calothrix sp. NIES-4101]